MRRRKPTNFLEAVERNRRKTALLIAVFILLSVAGGAGVDATLMTGLGEYWFSLFGVVALAGIWWLVSAKNWFKGPQSAIEAPPS